MNQEYLYVDIDVDSNNDGVINGCDDAVEMAANGGKILAVGYGQCQPINLSVHSSEENLVSDNIVYQLEYDNSRILLYNTANLPQAVYGTEIDISPYYIAPNTDLPNGFLTLDGTIKTIYVDGFVLGETTVTLKAYSVYQNSSGNMVRELISSDEIKLNVGFDLDTSRNGGGVIHIDDNLLFTDNAKIWIGPSVEDTVEDIAGKAPMLYCNTNHANEINIKTSDLSIPNGCELQLIVSPGLDAWLDAGKTQRLTNRINDNFINDNSLGEIYTWSGDLSSGDITVFIAASGALSGSNSEERLVHLRLVKTSSNPEQTVILARDTIRFQCINVEIDLLADSNNDGNVVSSEDNPVEDMSEFSGYIIPYDTLQYYGNDEHVLPNCNINIALKNGETNQNWDNKYVRVCQVNLNQEILQVLGVYQLGDRSVFTWEPSHSFYRFNDLKLLAEASSKNSYEAWIRVELYDQLPSDNTVQPTSDKKLIIRDIAPTNTLNLSTDSMLASDLIKMTATLFVMDRNTTFVVNDAKYAGMTESEKAAAKQYKWICNLKDGIYETPVTGGNKINYNNENGPAVSNNGKGDSYLRSALHYDNTGFVMNLDYSFVTYPDKDNNIDQYGYVQAQNKTNPDIKFGFVSNGGIKLGSTASSSYNPPSTLEISLLNVRAWVHMALGKNMNDEIECTDWSKFQFEKVFDENNYVDYEVSCPKYDKVGNFVKEKLSMLLNAVGYSQPLSSSISPINYLKQAYNLCSNSGSILIEQNPSVVTYGETSVLCNGVSTYVILSGEKDLPLNYDGRLYLQAHWGSGLVYTINSIIKKAQNV